MRREARLRRRGGGRPVASHRIFGLWTGTRERLFAPGEIYTLYLLDAYQRCGIGRRLLSASAEDMAAAGFSSMCVWVLAANPAREFYERLGGVELSTRDIGFAGRRLDEVCYVWPDLRRLEALEEH